MLKDVIEEWKGKKLNDLLVEMYITRDMTIPQIAEELHVSVGGVHKWLNQYEIYKQKNMWQNSH